MKKEKVEIVSEVRGLLAEILEVEPEEIKPDTHFAKDMGADSMSILEIIAALEDKYDIVIEPEKLAELSTLTQVSDFVSEVLNGK